MILFLDFDGVLHPFFPLPDRTDEENAYFAYWPRLLAVLDDHPCVEIVVSSSWRLISPEKWHAEVPESLKQRIAGKTPEIVQKTRKQYPVGYMPEPIRYLEIQKYLRSTRQADGPWIALDDDPLLFPADCQNLIICQEGFGAAEEAVLRHRLAAL